MLYLQIMPEAMDTSIVISAEIRVILFLLLNKQKLITYDMVESPSAVISMTSWVTEYLSMNKYYEGSPTLKIHSCSLIIIRLLPHHLLIFPIFFLLYTFRSVPAPPPPYVCAPQLCRNKLMWGLSALKEHGLASKSTICLRMYCMKNWEHEKMHKHLNNTKPTILHTQKSPFSEPILYLCGSHLRFILCKENNSKKSSLTYNLL